MKSNDSKKALLEKNLKEAVENCQKLKLGHLLLNSPSFKIISPSLLNMTAKDYLDGNHFYNMDANIEIKNEIGDKQEQNYSIHFNAIIDGVNVKIENEIIIADKH